MRYRDKIPLISMNMISKICKPVIVVFPKSSLVLFNPQQASEATMGNPGKAGRTDMLLFSPRADFCSRTTGIQIIHANQMMTYAMVFFAERCLGGKELA